MTRHYLVLFVEILSTYSQYLCYFFMLLSMMINAGLVSIIYPLSVFGFAMMEETSPKRTFWNIILVYTLALVLVKFIYQLNFWEAFIEPTSLQDFQNTLVSICL